MDIITIAKIIFILFTFIGGGVVESETKIIATTIYPTDDNETKIIVEYSNDKIRECLK